MWSVADEIKWLERKTLSWPYFTFPPLIWSAFHHFSPLLSGMKGARAVARKPQIAWSGLESGPTVFRIVVHFSLVHGTFPWKKKSNIIKPFLKNIYLSGKLTERSHRIHCCMLLVRILAPAPPGAYVAFVRVYSSFFPSSPRWKNMLVVHVIYTLS